ncbi:hypothetical protein BKA70DRAFT_1574389 [Coprinopsis sp. MPI-PUGE-AT-0042]|nr:hypothetical protein BKA70DRAFT_1574389 [Coprinopsis sp. MPI-PUGE-AT-0042]
MLLHVRNAGAAHKGIRLSRGYFRRLSGQTQLQVTPVGFPALEEGVGYLTCPRHSLLRSLTVHPNISIEHNPTTFVTTEALATGRSRLSQVYRGSLFPHVSGAGAMVKPMVNDVVLKIYDGSQFPTTEDMERSVHYNFLEKRLSLDEDDVFMPLLLAWQEAWVYDKLASSNASFVPQYLGAYELDFGKGQAFAIALSYVDGISFPEWLNNLNTETHAGRITRDERRRRKFRMAHAIYAVYSQLHDHGIHILDHFWGENIIITPSLPTSLNLDGKDTASMDPKVVMLDFDLTVSKEILDDAPDSERGLADMLYFMDIVAGQCKCRLKNSRLHRKLEKRDMRDLLTRMDARKQKR